MAEPNLNAFYDELCSAYAVDWGALSTTPGIAAGILVGSNPPYAVSDFLAFYPKFGGTPKTITATLTNGSAIVTTADTTGLAAGQVVANGAGVASGTAIFSVDSATQCTLSQAATASGTVQLQVYVAPFVPIVVLSQYVVLASASLQQMRWGSQWQIAMGLFVAHYATLYLRSDGNPATSAGQVAASGLNVGITVSKGAGPVAQGLALVGGLDGWASWQMTLYGQQLATMAKTVGMGPIWIR